MAVANRAGLLTHDLRGFLRAGMSIIDESNASLKLPWDRNIDRKTFCKFTSEQLMEVYDKVLFQQNAISDANDHLKDV